MTKNEQFNVLSKGLIAAHKRLAVAEVSGADTTIAETEVSMYREKLEGEHMPVLDHDEDEEGCRCVVCRRDDEDDDDEIENVENA